MSRRLNGGYELRYTGKPKEKLVRKSIKLPKIISEDLGYYMHFGFKRMPVSDNTSYQENKHSRVSVGIVADYYN